MRKSQTTDPVGIQAAVKGLDQEFCEIGLEANQAFTDSRVVWTWETSAGFEGGTLLIGHLDVPLEPTAETQMFRREPEWLYGEGIGSSRAPLVSLQFALRALRRVRRLRKTPIGVLYYTDEGRDCRYSAEIIRAAAGRAKKVLVLRPGNLGDHVVTARRGQRRYRLSVHGEPVRLGKTSRKVDVLPWTFAKLEECAAITSRKDRLAVATIDLKTTHLPMLLPHQVVASLLVSYPDDRAANQVEQQIRSIVADKRVRCQLEMISERPAMKERRANVRIAKELKAVADRWELPLERESSVWPSAAGLIAGSAGVVCGLGPVARDLYTPHEAIDRISLLQRTLLLAQFLAQQSDRE
jgi:D-alanine-D-alanine ligase